MILKRRFFLRRLTTGSSSLCCPSSSIINNNKSICIRRFATEDDNEGPSWQPQDNTMIQHVTQKAIIHELVQNQTQTIENVVPWFFNNMPGCYFRHVDWDTRMDHIKAISAVQDANMDLDMNLSSHLDDGRVILTFIRPSSIPGRLLKLVNELPWNYSNIMNQTKSSLPLSRCQVFTSEDETLGLFMFTYGHEAKPTDLEPVANTNIEEVGKDILSLAEHINKGTVVEEDGRNYPGQSPMLEKEKLLEYLSKCSKSFIETSDPCRFLIQREMFEEVSGTEGVSVRLEEAFGDDAGRYWVYMSVANSLPQVALENAARLLYVDKYDVLRAHLDLVDDGVNGTVSMIRMCVNPLGEGLIPNRDVLLKELKRIKWLDPPTMDLALVNHPSIGLTKGEIITAFSSLVHCIMAKENFILFSNANILETITKKRYISLTTSIADLFLDRFNPSNPLSDDDLQRRSGELQSTIDSDVEDTVAAELLNKMIDICKYTLRTNIYLENRYALGFRLDPRVMVANEQDKDRELPYGVIFVHGRRFNAFHVRFRDIARGGLRLVTPQTAEQYALESARQYEECYGLAYAQQLKNKDIPEGGSKAVCLIDTTGLKAGASEEGKNFVMRKSVKAFTDTILDLIVDTKDTQDNVVDYLGKREIIYLGPDEQVIPDDINWVVSRAAKRGYNTPAAFMSSKPRAGINHKEYGVTSEGVNVFLDVALRRTLGIDPKKDPFTIKMTGGPDGDVGGNCIKILLREYGQNARIVAIADHSGSAEDPNGLDHDELVRLVHNNLSIHHFNAKKLRSDGVLYHVDTEEGVKMRNTMHNRVKADAFVPAGGRPGTIDIHNYKHFLDEEGNPSSRLIVEAANIFITAEARDALFNEGEVLIVKDSSANKCGVITSSYEICAAMMLSEEEFYNNKDAIVEEVLGKLRSLAKMEAELLFREFDKYEGSLPEFSQIISKSINTTKDALLVALDTLSDEDKESLMSLFQSHLPPTLARIAFDRVTDCVPEQYIKNAIASSLASKIVYKEGPKFIESLGHKSLAETAIKYIKKEKEVAILKEALSAVDMPEAEKTAIMNLLEAGGTRTALNF